MCQNGYAALICQGPYPMPGLPLWPPVVSFNAISSQPGTVPLSEVLTVVVAEWSTSAGASSLAPWPLSPRRLLVLF